MNLWKSAVISYPDECQICLFVKVDCPQKAITCFAGKEDNASDCMGYNVKEEKKLFLTCKEVCT
jgi:hypothetical protein